MDSKAIANLFLEEYFKVMQLPRQARQNLISFYQNSSQMTYTGSTYVGLKDIAEKIESFGFENIKYANLSSDVQDGPLPGSIVVFVSGYLCMDGAEEFRFAQVFNICPNGTGGYFIHNDIFSVIVWFCIVVKLNYSYNYMSATPI